ncbi:MAG: HAMP domain-containing sensor histidine kinase [Campylobacterota bacterium]|nr:HAMP domain-containing sensor histidine kinase [Campylobacterota bacterium]
MIEKDYFSDNKLILLKYIIVITGVVIFVMSLIRFGENNYSQSAADMLFVFILIWGFLKLKYDSSSFRLVARIILFFATAIAFYLLINIHSTPMRFIWFTTVVYLMFYLFDKKEGLLWAAAVGVILLAIFLYDKNIMDMNSKDFFIWIFNMFIILLIVNLYENMKEESTQKLLHSQQTLSAEVASKTLELQKLNEGLEKRIEKEMELARYQEQMIIQQSRQAQMGEMLSMIAHQWRQPLTAISATSSLIEMKARMDNLDPENTLKSARNISKYAQHLSATINDFRDFFKPNKELMETSYDEIVESVLGIIEISIVFNQIELHKELSCQAKFNSYPNELKQVILNLIKNAEDVLLEKKVEKPFIGLTTYQDDDKFILEVSDNGGGIPEEILEKIFDFYFTTKQDKNGTGLGLYMSKTIIEEHCHGKLSAENSKDGALFRIELH